MDFVDTRVSSDIHELNIAPSSEVQQASKDSDFSSSVEFSEIFSDFQCSLRRVNKAQRAKLKAAYREEHPAEPPAEDSLEPSKHCSEQTHDSWCDCSRCDRWREAVELARMAQRVVGERAVAERVRGRFQKQLALRKADRARSKEIRRSRNEN